VLGEGDLLAAELGQAEVGDPVLWCGDGAHLVGFSPWIRIDEIEVKQSTASR
jgi:hypothetical protein